MIPTIVFRYAALVSLLVFVTIVWIGPILFLSYLWVLMRSATPILIGDREHKEVHCRLQKDLDRVAFTEGLPRQRACDLGAAYIVLEGDDDPDTEGVDAVYDTPLTEQQPSWFDLVESPDYKEWRKVRVDLTEPLREAVEEKQELYSDYLDRLRTQCNRLIAGVQKDLDISDIDELQGDDWAGVDLDDDQDDLDPAGPDQVDDRVDPDVLDLIDRSHERRGVRSDD
ncbi:hypothetical protein [Natrialba sp. SSL1]|uniref:hypothetical protein n=1 Tax=Natrialba sp. SSL1 TaxID=1869245 RepID=UPI0008F83406|nr:hypothetical protein [Natrialba sp. SSL1]OIB58175.1 hypothetical protein BBD46_09860 [Natrialba sp. SSL1]